MFQYLLPRTFLSEVPKLAILTIYPDVYTLYPYPSIALALPSQDGRLAINDQLVRVNGASLLGVSNTVAMDTLRRAMQKDGGAESIQLVIARRKLPLVPQPASRDVRISASDMTGVASPQLSPITKDAAFVKDMDKNANKNNYMDLNSAAVVAGGERLGVPGRIQHPRQRSADGGYLGNSGGAAAPVTLVSMPDHSMRDLNSFIFTKSMAFATYSIPGTTP